MMASSSGSWQPGEGKQGDAGERNSPRLLSSSSSGLCSSPPRRAPPRASRQERREGRGRWERGGEGKVGATGWERGGIAGRGGEGKVGATGWERGGGADMGLSASECWADLPRQFLYNVRLG